MDVLPQRQSLVGQVVEILRDRIQRGVWQEWLPGERALCEQLQVSRNTLRAALVILQDERVIRPLHGSGNRILIGSKSKPGVVRQADVAVLTPEALERLRPAQALWIDELRAMLSERGSRLHVFHGKQYYQGNPGPALGKLVAQNPHGCWILALASEATQRWFAGQRVPCIVAGSVYAGIDLPFRDIDHRALCRHAAGVLLAKGHRCVALLTPTQGRAGDLESEAGFIEGVQQSPRAEAEAVVVHHDASVASICKVVRRTMESPPPPTAWLVANAYHYLTVVTQLMQLGKRVPADVSVISRDEDSFLSFMVPTPARYVASPQMMGKALLPPVLDLLSGRAISPRSARIMPDFVPGDTLAAPFRV